MPNPFTEHPSSKGESYLRHALVALSVSFRFFISSLFMIVHAIFPFLSVPWPFNLSAISFWLMTLEEHRNILKKNEENKDE